MFDTIIGYEVFDAGSNPNYTRSWGYAVEPTEHTGILATYKINDEWSVSAGIANTLMAGINAARRITNADYNACTRDWNKTYMGSITYTAPSSWGWAAGSSIYAGAVYGFDGGSFDNGTMRAPLASAEWQSVQRICWRDVEHAVETIDNGYRI